MIGFPTIWNAEISKCISFAEFIRILTVMNEKKMREFQDRYDWEMLVWYYWERYLLKLPFNID